MLKIATAARCEVLDGMEKYFCNAYYTDAFLNHGAQLIISPVIESADWMAEVCDALLIPGGNDMDSKYFDEPMHPLAIPYTRDIDGLDYALIEAFIKVGKPILGICRGLQVLNVFFHGTLEQHFDKDVHAMSDESQPMHELNIQAETFMSKLYPSTIQINSYHHQRIAKLGEHLKVVATHPDGTIEAIEHLTLPIWAVQWHPERMGENDQIISAFIQSCSHR